jgi:prepilin-type N-terminal cleavage/methylation domain-containing protein
MSRGFTLLEVLVAFVISSLSLIVLFRGAGEGLTSVRVAGEYQQAVSLMRSKLAEFGQSSAALTPGFYEGDADDPSYHWVISIRSLGNIGSVQPLPRYKSTAPGLRHAPPTTLFSIDLAISWVEQGRRRQYEITTNRLGPTPRGGIDD